MWCDSCLALTLILLVSTIAGCRRDASDTSTLKPIVLPVAAIKTKTQSGFSFPITYYGRIQPARRTLLAFEIPGQVAELLVDEGEVVKAGESVARLNTSILDAERKRLLATKTVEQTILRRLKKGQRHEVIAAARAVVRKLDAELQQAIRKRDRLQNLRGQQAASVSQYESAFYQSKSLQASLSAAKARLLELETGTREEDVEAQNNRLLELDARVSVHDARIEKAVLLAPFAANIIKRMADEGAVVQEGQPIFVLSEADQYEARFSVPVTQLEEAEETSTISVSGKEVPVRQARTISSVSPETRSIDVVFTLAPKSRIIEGQTCTLQLTEMVETTCLKLPVSALVPSVRGLWSVYRLEEDVESENFRVIKEEVTINHTDGDRVYVETSLPDSSLIVGEGVHKLVAGMLVRIKDDEP